MKIDGQCLKSSDQRPSSTAVLLTLCLWITEIIFVLLAVCTCKPYGSTSEPAMSATTDGASWLSLKEFFPSYEAFF